MLTGVYRLTIRVATTAVSGREGAVTVYVRGGFGRGDPVIGLSDVDLITVIDDRLAGAPDPGVLVARWERARRLLPFAGSLVSLEIYRTSELAQAMRGPTHVFGLDDAGHEAVHRAVRAPPAELLVRPGLYEITSDWTLLRGREVRSPRGPWPEDRRGLVAWLELQNWWRHAVRLSAGVPERRAPYRALRVITESARVWLWVAHGVRTADRTDVLRRTEAALRNGGPRSDTAEATFELAAELLRDPRRERGIDRGLVLCWIHHLTELTAAVLLERASAAPTATVRLVGERGAGSTHPLVDWRAIVIPSRPVETFTLERGRPDDLAAVARAVAAYRPGHYVALRTGPVLIKPVLGSWGASMLRSVHLPLSDPVSFALADGADTALFPELPGWSASDVARRAVAEHGAFLARRAPHFGMPGVVLLISATRAALFHESLAAGSPELSLGPDDVLAALAGTDTRLRWLGTVGHTALLDAASDGATPDEQTVGRLRDAVMSLPPFRSG